MATMKDTKMQPAKDAVIEELRKVIADCYWPTSPVTINEILDRLEAAESEGLEQARLNGMGSEREAALMAKLEAAEKDIAIKEEVIDSLATVIKRLDAQCDAAEKSDAESLAMYRKARDERDALRAALTDLLNDLEERAPLNIEKSPRVVACGNSVYVQAKAALEATP